MGILNLQITHSHEKPGVMKSLQEASPKISWDSFLMAVPDSKD